jgi:heme/copper-type cytochrome/quinol oxidase subunit 1
MPRLSVWLVRTALGFLAVGFSLGAVLLAGRGLGAGSWLAHLLPVHAEFLLVGWTVQLVLGIVYWILPLSRTGAERGSPALAWAAFWTLNMGVMLAALGGALGSPSTLALTGRVLETLAAAALAVLAWPRIRQARRGV